VRLFSDKADREWVSLTELWNGKSAIALNVARQIVGLLL
jgi:hypothetical protein